MPDPQVTAGVGGLLGVEEQLPLRALTSTYSRKLLLKVDEPTTQQRLRLLKVKAKYCVKDPQDRYAEKSATDSSDG